MDGAQNIPYLAGKEVDYQLYRHVIQSSFKKMNQLLLNDKVAFIEKVKKLFSNTAIRLIYRDTQDYGNLLNFTLHTESMSNYIEREKIIENLWASQIIPEALIPFEIQAMLDHDIPLITANTSLTNVYTNGYELPNLLAKTPLQDTVEHMEKITEKTSHFSYLLLKESLGTLEYKLQEITIAEKNSSMDQPLLQKAADIGDKIIDQIDINYDLGEVDWMSVLPESATEIGIEYPDTDLYSGSAGVYLFLVYLNYYVPKKSYQEIIALLEKDIFLIKKDINTYESAFFADGMRVTVAFYVTKLLKDAKHRSYMETGLRSLKESRTTPITIANEWLYGKASLIATLATVYQTFHNKDAYELLLRYTQEITLEEMEDNSFAHGYAGICYGLNSANQVLQPSTVEEKLKWYQQRFETQLYKEDSLNASWCRGITGIKEVCHVLNRSFPNKNIMRIEDESREEACLCHGRYGNNDNYLNNILKLSGSVIKLKSDIENTPIGLFCGLAGIGYQLLRAYDPVNVHSLLFIK